MRGRTYQRHAKEGKKKRFLANGYRGKKIAELDSQAVRRYSLTSRLQDGKKH
jgi:hypothetical protein